MTISERLRDRVDIGANGRWLAASGLMPARARTTRSRRVGIGLPDLDNASPSGGRHRRPLPLLVGVDIVSVAEVAAALDRFGDRYIRRLFTPREAAYCRSADRAVAAARFAVRFAAKEAAVKALQPEQWWTDWCAIEVRRWKSGRCALALHGEAAALAARRGIRHLALSMSHEREIAAAVVVALGTAQTDARRKGVPRHG
jgi:holo-[acyl-carrier protein] synthase